ncbi:TetR/AcrR family transcriptional regulator [Nocardia sp. NPDC057668]|uniref:TetR/AcrR family transcriptional regulator n=1 Tax=Nocardia sp. NPDC057668 TaxID=3346202 RepID=UPI00366AD5BC
MDIVSRVSPGPLPPGPTGLTREQVLASQWGRLGWSALYVVSEQGYQATTVSDIVKRAQVSRRTFYQFFADKQECYVAAFELTVEVVENLLRTALEPYRGLNWKVLLRKSLEEYLAILTIEPALARALHVEALAAGQALAVHRGHMKKVFVDRMTAVHALGVTQGELGELPIEGMLDLLIGGIDDRIRDCLNDAGPSGLGELAAVFYETSVAVLGSKGLN